MTEINFKELTKTNEATIIGGIFDNIDILYDHPELKHSDFFNPKWKIYFAILKKMSEQGIKQINEPDIEVFLAKKGNEQLKAKYIEYDGFNSLDVMSGLFNKENVESYIDQQKKWVAFSQVVKIMNFNEDEITKINDLSVNQLYDYYNGQFNHIFMNVNEDVKTSNLNDGLDDIINEADEGIKRGLNIPSPILNDTINGITRGQIMLIGGQSGSGKTTFLIQTILSAVFESEEAGVFFLNEQDHKKIKMEMLTWIINNKVLTDKDKPFNKVRWRDGGFTEEERTIIKRASQILNEKMQNNRIIIVEFKTYTHKTVIRSIKKYAAMGVKVFAIDTFKLSSDADSSQPFWLVMQNQMKELDDLVKPSNLNVSLVCTLQLGKGAIINRYLSANDLGMSKNIIDVASVCLLIRKVHNDEYAGGKNEITVIQPIKGTSSGKDVSLDSSKRHSVIFITKNRNGEADHEQIVARHELGYLKYEEIGVTQIPFGT